MDGRDGMGDGDDEVMSEDAALLSMFFFSVSVCFLGGVLGCGRWR